MLKHNLHGCSSSAHQTLIFSRKPILSVGGNATATAAFPIPHKNINSIRSRKFPTLRRRRSSSAASVKAVATSSEKSTELKARAIVLQTVGGALSNLGTRGLDDISDLFGRSMIIELVAADLDSNGKEKKTIKAYARKVGNDENKVYYEANFNVPEDFGEVGALLVENEHHREMYVRNIVLQGPYIGEDTDISCESWIEPKSEKRVFFSNKSYLPSQTPSGLEKYRQSELEILRGDGTGERKTTDRIYDYDVYNDLGDPDADEDLARPILGGSNHPYPRRCRTGRPMTKKDPSSETRVRDVYVPRDEAFSEVKQVTFSAKTVYSVLHALIPGLKSSAVDTEMGFPHFTAIDTLFNEGVLLPEIPASGFLDNIIPRVVRAAKDARNNVLQFETPELIDRDKFSWLRDAEFGRQTLAGLNPCCLKLVTEWPIKSALDPAVYGPAESAITTEIIEKEIGGIMTVQEAIEQKKLFILDYHDVYLPYVSKVRELKGTTLYGSRALFFLMPTDTLRPLAIELTRPPMDGKPQWREVYVESWDATNTWLWRLAKAHVLAHDSGFHQLVSHWLRTHACTEPYIIASHRQLSTMHPIYRLLHPHFRYTMEINALARSQLINADGIIESSFAPGKYSIELSSVAYDLLWQFDLQALPADLINRGMAVEDPNEPHGLKLTIEDYPYAADGLLIWDAIKQWVADYVPHYYPDDSSVQTDTELQAWWWEIRNLGHGDKKDAKWWPELKTPDNLIHILTIIIWIASGHHAAVNFGQFDFAGYFPNRPTTARKNMPTEDPKESERKQFMERPEEFLLDCFPSQLQATKVMAILDVLSTHSPDEEYIGEQIEPYFKQDKFVNAAFERFNGRLKEIEGIIDDRNIDGRLKNRFGAGVVPYQLLKPYSEPGVTGKGIPNSISI